MLLRCTSFNKFIIFILSFDSVLVSINLFIYLMFTTCRCLSKFVFGALCNFIF